MTESADQVEIELARDADAAEISELSRRYIEYGLRQAYTPQRIRELIRHRSKNVVVARAARRLVGFGIMSYGENSANLDLLAVRKACRGRGVGGKIVAWLGKVATTAGIALLFVQVREQNDIAIRFYQRLGFNRVERIAGYYQGREPAVILCRNLRSLLAAAPSPPAAPVPRPLPDSEKPR